MYPRELATELENLAKGYPVVTITGPRQSGKTTLAQSTFPKMPYVNLEVPDTRNLAINDPRGFLDKYPDGAILDEIQRAPDLLSYIQDIVDRRDQPGMFILTGSHQLELSQAITQSLAGRTALLSLLPMSIRELESVGLRMTLEEHLIKGGFPRIYKKSLNPTVAYRNYFQTYVERDLRQLIHVKDLDQFQRFVRLCAARVGSLVNMESLGNDVGVSSHTIKHWLSILEASYIIIQLRPYHENFGKRLIKSPKIYFTDVGLACYLLGIETPGQVDLDRLKGSLVENLVLLEIMKARLNQGLDPNLYYFRDAHGNEVDLIYQIGRDLIPIEIKSGRTFQRQFLKGLNFFKALAKERCKGGYLIYAGKEEQSVESFKLLHYQKAARIIEKP